MPDPHRLVVAGGDGKLAVVAERQGADVGSVARCVAGEEPLAVRRHCEAEHGLGVAFRAGLLALLLPVPDAHGVVVPAGVDARAVGAEHPRADARTMRAREAEEVLSRLRVPDTDPA